MASSSGINGPGDTETPTNNNEPIVTSTAPTSSATDEEKYDTSDGGVGSSQPSSSHHVDEKENPQVDSSGGPQVDKKDVPQVDSSGHLQVSEKSNESGEPSSGTPPSGGASSGGASSGRHLDFNLLINQPVEPAVGMRRMESSTNPVSSPRGWQQTQSDHQIHQKNTDVLANIMRRIPTDVPPSTTSTSTLKPTSNLYASQLYNEDDFSSHRRNVVHMSHPMNTRLSSNDLKTITQAATQFTTVDPNKKSRRHRSSSKSISPDRRSSKERKEQKKQRKKKEKTKRKRGGSKTLTSGVHGRSISIPEEEDEEDSESGKKQIIISDS